MEFNANIIIFFVIVIVGIVSYQTNSLSSKVKCVLTTPTNTEEVKWININSPIVKFKINKETRIFYNNPKFIKHSVKRDGLFMFFPTKIDTEYFAWNSKWPLDPLTLQPTSEAPDIEANLQLSQDLQDYAQGYNKAMLSGKQGLFAQWMPIITIIGFIIVGFFIYQVNANTTNVGNAVNVLQGMMQNYMTGAGK